MKIDESLYYVIARVVWNCTKIVWYKTQMIALYIGDWVSEHQRNLPRSIDYLDKPRYIKAGYDDEYDIEDYVTSDDSDTAKPYKYDGPYCETP